MKNPLRLLYLDHNYTYIGKVSWNTLFGQTQFSKVCPFNIMSLKVREIIHLIAVSTFLVMRVLILHLINTMYSISIIRLFTWVHCEPLWNERKTSTVCVVFYCLTRKAVHQLRPDRKCCDALYFHIIDRTLTSELRPKHTVRHVGWTGHPPHSPRICVGCPGCNHNVLLCFCEYKCSRFLSNTLNNLRKVASALHSLFVARCC